MSVGLERLAEQRLRFVAISRVVSVSKHHRVEAAYLSSFGTIGKKSACRLATSKSLRRLSTDVPQPRRDPQ